MSATQSTAIGRLVWWTFGIALALIAVYAIGYGTRPGWFGVGLTGLLILLISIRVDLEADYPGALHTHATAEPNLAARQVGERSRASPEQRLEFIAARQKRRRILYLVRCFGVVLTVVGFGLFLKQQI